MVKQSEERCTEEMKEAEAQKIEAGVFVPLRKRSMSLRYVAPVIKQGIPTAKLCVSEIEREVEKWKIAVILYVIGESPTISYLKFFLQN